MVKKRVHAYDTQCAMLLIGFVYFMVAVADPDEAFRGEVK